MDDLTSKPLGDPRFHAELKALADLHIAKAADYGRGEDPLANLRASVMWGIPPWRATLLRLGDKVHRLASYALNGKLQNEGVVDSLRDLAAYALLAKILLEEEQ